MVLFAVSSFTCSMPHFIFGEQLIHANDLLFSGVVSTHATHGAPLGPNSTEPVQVPPNICRVPSDLDDEHPPWGANTTNYGGHSWATQAK